ncbi:MAG: ATP-binding cassette domain-containing protein [Nitrospirota bacterium]
MSLTCHLKGVYKSYGGRTILEPSDFYFPPGKITCIIGPNGSGKSTLLKIASYLVKPDGGAVEYDDGGSPVAFGMPLRRRLTCVAQAPLLFNTTLYKNIAYGLKFRNLSDAEIKARAEEALELGGLSHLAGAGAKTLSGGEAQRAAMVRAYALQAEVVFLDEPFSNLDPEGGQLMERLTLRMKDEGVAVALVTHNLFQARRLSDRVYFLFKGRLIEFGEADGFFNEPREELTRQFLSGEMFF